eukprot:3278738-Rhodomonas_salina.3
MSGTHIACAATSPSHPRLDLLPPGTEFPLIKAPREASRPFAMLDLDLNRPAACLLHTVLSHLSSRTVRTSSLVSAARAVLGLAYCTYYLARVSAAHTLLKL